MLTIVSGGQTGVDRAALDVALGLGLPAAGWCPAGRLAEDGPIPAHYPLHETPSADPTQRTRWNVRDSDGTMVLGGAIDSPGTALTLAAASELGRPVYLWERSPDAEAFGSWLRARAVRILNVAGPRESESPGIYEEACLVLEVLLAPLTRPEQSCVS